jgi:hypothetical protein
MDAVSAAAMAKMSSRSTSVSPPRVIVVGSSTAATPDGAS